MSTTSEFSDSNNDNMYQVLYDQDLLQLITSHLNNESESINYNYNTNTDWRHGALDELPMPRDLELYDKRVPFRRDEYTSGRIWSKIGIFTHLQRSNLTMVGKHALFYVNRTFRCMSVSRLGRLSFYGRYPSPCNLISCENDLKHFLDMPKMRLYINRFGITSRYVNIELTDIVMYKILTYITSAIIAYESNVFESRDPAADLVGLFYRYKRMISTYKTDDVLTVDTYGFPLYMTLMNYLRINRSELINVNNMENYYSIYAYVLRVLIHQNIITLTRNNCEYRMIKPVNNCNSCFIEDAVILMMCEDDLCELFIPYDAKNRLRRWGQYLPVGLPGLVHPIASAYTQTAYMNFIDPDLYRFDPTEVAKAAPSYECHLYKQYLEDAYIDNFERGHDETYDAGYSEDDYISSDEDDKDELYPNNGFSCIRRRAHASLREDKNCPMILGTYPSWGHIDRIILRSKLENITFEAADIRDAECKYFISQSYLLTKRPSECPYEGVAYSRNNLGYLHSCDSEEWQRNFNDNQLWWEKPDLTMTHYAVFEAISGPLDSLYSCNSTHRLNIFYYKLVRHSERMKLRQQKMESGCLHTTTVNTVCVDASVETIFQDSLNIFNE